MIQNLKHENDFLNCYVQTDMHILIVLYMYIETKGGNCVKSGMCFLHGT